MKEIPIALPYLGEEEIKAVSEVIASGWITQGPRVAQFEKNFAEYVGSKFAVAVSSCTTALHLSLLAVGVKPGDVVITVSHSFIATANSIRHCGAEPVFVDIEAESFNMDPNLLEAVLRTDFQEQDGALTYKKVAELAAAEESPLRYCSATGRLGAILLVHQVGLPADLKRVLAIAEHYGVPVVEDAACALGSEIEGARIGRPHGDVACFSFHPRKIISTGDGGMITTNDPERDRRFRLLRQHGMSISDVSRHAAQAITFESYDVTGYNYRMTDLQAAMGIEQLAKLPRIVAERRRLAAIYQSELKGYPGVLLPAEPDEAVTNWQSFIVRIASEQLEIMQCLRESGVHTRRAVMCAHMEAPYSAAWPKGSLPVSESVRDSGIMLPLYPGMTDDDVLRVCFCLKQALKD